MFFFLSIEKLSARARVIEEVSPLSVEFLSFRYFDAVRATISAQHIHFSNFFLLLVRLEAAEIYFDHKFLL